MASRVRYAGWGGLRIADYRVAMPETSTVRATAACAMAIAMVLAWRAADLMARDRVAGGG